MALIDQWREGLSNKKGRVTNHPMWKEVVSLYYEMVDVVESDEIRNNSDDPWKEIYDLIFSVNGSHKMFGLFKEIGVRFEYCDPDTSYKEDVESFMAALKAFIF